MPKTKLLAAALAGALALAAGSSMAQQVYRSVSKDGMTVLGNAGGFEVLSVAGKGKADYFCAAGKFAVQKLGATNNHRVAVVRGLGPSVSQPTRFSVLYTLRAPGRSSGTVEMLAGPRQGQITSVGHARSLCRVTGGGSSGINFN